jgi:hypothetical protein
MQIKRFIFLLPFGLYYCIAPVTYDKAKIDKGKNYYAGITAFGQHGTTPSCNGSEKYTSIGAQFTGGMYYGFNENLGTGTELSVSVSGIGYEDDSQINLLPMGNIDLYFKLALPFKNFTIGAKAGIGYPQVLSGGIYLGIPREEKITLIYQYKYPFHSVSLNCLFPKGFLISTGIYSYYLDPEENTLGFFIGFGKRK